MTLFDIDQPSCGVVGVEAVGVALGDELAVFHDDDAAGAEGGGIRFGEVVAEGARDRLLDGRGRLRASARR